MDTDRLLSIGFEIQRSKFTDILRFITKATLFGSFANFSKDPAPCVAAYCWSSSAGVWTRGALSKDCSGLKVPFYATVAWQIAEQTSKRVNFSRLNADYTSNREDYDRFSAEFGSMGLSEWISYGDFPYSDYRLSPECTEMLFTEGENVAARNYTVQLAHLFSHLGNYRRPVDPSLWIGLQSCWFFAIQLYVQNL